MARLACAVRNGCFHGEFRNITGHAVDVEKTTRLTRKRRGRNPLNFFWPSFHGNLRRTLLKGRWLRRSGPTINLFDEFPGAGGKAVSNPRFRTFQRKRLQKLRDLPELHNVVIRGERHWDALWLELRIAQTDQLILLAREIGFGDHPFRPDRVFCPEHHDGLHRLDALAQDFAIGLAGDQPPIVPDGDVLAFEFVRKAWICAPSLLE